jgi:hypothetical protein
VIEGEAPASGGEQPTNDPMICGEEFSGEILLVFFFAHRCLFSGSHGGARDYGD